jgi:hypothetical protein
LLRRNVATTALLLIPVLGAVLLLGDSLLGGKVFAPGDVSLTVVPFAPVRPPGWLGPANPGVTDPVFLFEPLLLFAREAVRGGHLPLWNPGIGLGRPLGAEQGAPLFPISWLAYLLPFWRSLAWIALAKFLVAFTGTFALARHHGTGRVAAAFAAAAFAFGTLFIVTLTTSQSNVGAMLPWALLAADRVVGGRWSQACVLGLVVGVAAYGGHPETWFVLCCGVAAILLARLFQRRRGLREPLLLIVVAVLVAALVGALFGLPFGELLIHASNASRGQGQPDSLKEVAGGLFFPEWWGRSDKAVYEAHFTLARASSVFPGRAYLGVAPVLAVVGSLVLPWRRAQRFYLALAAVCLAYMIGVPGLRQLGAHLPVFGQTNRHYFIWLFSVCLAMSGGLGLDALSRVPSQARRRALRLAAVFAAGAALVVLIANHNLFGALPHAFSQLPSQQRAPGATLTSAGAVLRWIALAVLTLLAIWGLGWRPRRAALAATAVLALTVADLLTIGAGYNPSLPARLAHPPAPPAFVIARAHEPSRIVGPYQTAEPVVAGLYSLADVRSYDLPFVARYTDTLEALGGATDFGQGRSYVYSTPAFGEPGPVIPGARTETLLDLLGARYVIDGGGMRPSARGVSIVGAGTGWRLLENGAAFPRAWVAYNWRPVSSLRADLDAVRRSSAAQLRADPVIETRQPPPTGATAAAGPAVIRAEGDQSLTVKASLARSGYLIVDDLFYPGWSATVDRRSVSIVPADGMLRAVALGPGAHTVRLSYVPESVEVGEILTLVGLVAGSGGAAFAIRQRWASGGRGRARIAR